MQAVLASTCNASQDLNQNTEKGYHPELRSNFQQVADSYYKALASVHG